MEKLISKGELKEKLSGQILSDIDGCDKETPYSIAEKLKLKLKIFVVGLFGGILGETILFFNTLKIMGFENVVSVKKFEKNISNCFNHFLIQSIVEIPIDEKIVPELAKIDESMNFENILTMQVDKIEELKDLLIKNFGSLVLCKMIDNFENLNLDNVLLKEILSVFFKIAFESDNGILNNKRNINKIYLNNKIAKNIKLVKITKPNNYKKRVALCHLFPSLEELPFAEEILEKKEKEGNDEKNIK